MCARTRVIKLTKSTNAGKTQRKITIVPQILSCTGLARVLSTINRAHKTAPLSVEIIIVILNYVIIMIVFAAAAATCRTKNPARGFPCESFGGGWGGRGGRDGTAIVSRGGTDGRDGTPGESEIGRETP